MTAIGADGVWYISAMLKRLALLAVLLALVCSIPVPGQSPDHGSKASHNPESKATNSQTPSKPTLTLVEKNCDSEQFKDDGDCKAAKDNEKPIVISKLPTANVAIQSNAKRDAFDWWAYVANIVLAGVGFAGVFVGWRTLRWLRVQTQAIRRSAEVQEAEFIQWVDIGNWSIKHIAPVIDFDVVGNTVARKPKEIDITMLFSVLNNTSRPLTIGEVATSLQVAYWPTWKEFTVSERRRLPPKGEFTVSIDLRLEGNEVDRYIMNALYISIAVVVTFENALGLSDKTSFPRFAACGINAQEVTGIRYSAREVAETKQPPENNAT